MGYFERAARLYCKEAGIHPDLSHDWNPNWMSISEELEKLHLMMKCLKEAENTKPEGTKI